MRLFIKLCLISVLAFTGCSDKESFVVYDLRCENLNNPLGIDKISPRFSWKIRSNNNGTEQQAFQLMVASSPLALETDNADLWNSGMIESSHSVLVPYQGEKLKPGSVAYWKVRIWDESGEVTPWSTVSEFSIGLLDDEDWYASYIGFETEARDCPQLKNSFFINGTEGRMFLHVNSLGYHEVYINGEKVGDGVLTPAVSQFDKRSLVITYDISSLVKEGNNDIILWLSYGWYHIGFPGVYNDGPLIKAQLERITGNHREIILVTDSTWKGRNSSYRWIGRGLVQYDRFVFGGEEVNGKLVANDLFIDELDHRSWGPVKEITIPQHGVSPQMVELNKITKTIEAVSVSQLPGDAFLIDMGTSITGWVEIHFPELRESQEIILEYADHLNINGQLANQRQIDRYFASGKDGEVFKNKFSYSGLRYIKISNLDKAPGLDSVKAHLIHTDHDLASNFVCSDPDINSIHDMVFYTLRNLSLGGYFVDCPHIERLGYGGDGNASNVTALTMFNLAPLYTHWMQVWADCQREDGGMPHTAPNPIPAGGGPYWTGFIIPASWQAYMNYGDSEILANHYPVMQKWLEYVEEHSPDGLLKRWPETDYRNWYLGDWATPKGVDQTDEASVDLVNNCFISVCYAQMQKIARVLNKPDDAKIYAQKKNQLNTLIHQTFFNSMDNSYATGTQIDLTYPLIAGVVPEQLKHLVRERLLNEIEMRHGHFATGLVGIPVFTEWATEYQEADLMYSMLKKKEYPGYLYMIENGATTTWEHWEGNRSRIHNCYNGIGSWFYQAVGGIRPLDPAYKKALIQPQIPDGITWAKTSKETPYGTLIVNWEVDGESIKMELEIPVGMEIEIPLPSKVGEYMFNGKRSYVYDDESPLIVIKSGKYDVSYSPYK